MRKGYSLIEMLMVLTLMSSLIVVLGEPIHMLLSEVPRVSRLPYVQGTVQAMLMRLQGDVDAAEGLLVVHGAYQADEKTLLIQVPEGVVVYRALAEGVTREVLGVDGEGALSTEVADEEEVVYEQSSEPNNPNAAVAVREDWTPGWVPEELTERLREGTAEGVRWWSIPHGSIFWRLRVNESGSYAVEVHTGLYRGRERKGQAKLQNVRVFYVRALPGEVQP